MKDFLGCSDRCREIIRRESVTLSILHMQELVVEVVEVVETIQLDKLHQLVRDRRLE